MSPNRLSQSITSKLAGEVAALLLVAAAIGLPLVLSLPKFFLLGVEGQLALD